MPELPEVETVRRGLAPHLEGRRIATVRVYDRRLRWPIQDTFAQDLTGKVVRGISRRAKYLLVDLGQGTLMIHLGMSGSLRIVDPGTALRTHDHVEMTLDDGPALRFHDPRRFGSMFYFEHPPVEHPLLATLGPEPLSDEFRGGHLYRTSRGRRIAIKPFIMDAGVVVGVGNIYASEALFAAGIHPVRKAGRVSAARYDRLANCIKSILARAVAEGGTTLRDFIREDGSPGYFKQSLAVYGRGKAPCIACGSTLREVRLGQRSTVYCPVCQR